MTSSGGEEAPAGPKSADTWEVTIFVIVMGLVMLFSVCIIYRCEVLHPGVVEKHAARLQHTQASVVSTISQCNCIGQLPVLVVDNMWHMSAVLKRWLRDVVFYESSDCILPTWPSLCVLAMLGTS